MTTIAPSRLKDVTDAALFMALVQDNLEILAEEVAKRLPRYQNGPPTTLIGPPTSGAHVLNEFWRDALGAEHRCTAAETPSTWIQIENVYPLRARTGVLLGGGFNRSRWLRDRA